MTLKLTVGTRGIALYHFNCTSTLCMYLASPLPPSHDVAPTVRIEPRFLEVFPGDRVEFRCLATGIPEPTLEWVGGRNGRLGPHTSFRNGVFSIPAVRKSDEAEYRCIAKNRAGMAEVRTIIYVRGGLLTLFFPSNWLLECFCLHV